MTNRIKDQSEISSVNATDDWFFTYFNSRISESIKRLIGFNLDT